MWQAIPYVTGIFSLGAFLAAIAAYSYTQRLRQRGNLIQSCPETQRSALVLATLEYLNIDPGTLSEKQRYAIALKQIEERGKRFRWTVILGALISALAVVVFIVSLLSGAPKPSSAETQRRADAAIKLSPFFSTLADYSVKEQHFLTELLWKTGMSDTNLIFPATRDKLRAIQLRDIVAHTGSPTYVDLGWLAQWIKENGTSLPEAIKEDKTALEMLLQLGNCTVDHRNAIWEYVNWSFSDELLHYVKPNFSFTFKNGLSIAPDRQPLQFALFLAKVTGKRFEYLDDMREVISNLHTQSVALSLGKAGSLNCTRPVPKGWNIDME